MLNLFAPKPVYDPEVSGRIKTWVREVMGFPEETVVTVLELRCQEDDCPDVETVVAVLGEPGQARQHKLAKPMGEVTFADIVSLATRGTHG